MGSHTLPPPQEDPPHTLFSSASCRYCHLFINELNRCDLLNSFHIVDITRSTFDTSRIRVVPTVVLDRQHVLSGRQAFAWLKNEAKNMVVGVDEQLGCSAAFAMINEDAPGGQIYDVPTPAHFDEVPLQLPVLGNVEESFAEQAGKANLEDHFEAMKRERNM